MIYQLRRERERDREKEETGRRFEFNRTNLLSRRRRAKFRLQAFRQAENSWKMRFIIEPLIARHSLKVDLVSLSSMFFIFPPKTLLYFTMYLIIESGSSYEFLPLLYFISSKYLYLLSRSES